jgi:hypothetical protein
MAKPGSDRLQRVLKLRDAALEVIRREGTWDAARNHPSLHFIVAEKNGLKFLHRAPFSSGPPARPSASYEQELVRQRAAPDLPYTLDIWSGTKVLSLQWDDAGKVNLISFKPGNWEMQLVETAFEAGSASAAG